MKAILIDTPKKRIREIEILSDITQIYAALGVNLIECICPDILKHYDVMYLDEEGLLKESQPFFVIDTYKQPLAGRAIIMGLDEDGEWTDCQTPLNLIQQSVQFI